MRSKCISGRGSAPKPSWGSLQRSLRLPSWWGGNVLAAPPQEPLPRSRLSASNFGPSSLRSAPPRQIPGYTAGHTDGHTKLKWIYILSNATQCTRHWTEKNVSCKAASGERSADIAASQLSEYVRHWRDWLTDARWHAWYSASEICMWAYSRQRDVITLLTPSKLDAAAKERHGTTPGGEINDR